MNHQKGRMGWMEWSAVFVVVVLFPLWFGYDIVRNLSEERLAKWRDDREAWVERTGGPLFMDFSPGLVLGQYFAQLYTIGSGANLIFKELHNRFPGAFRIHFFDRMGKPQPVPGEFRFLPSEELNLFSTTFLSRGFGAISYFHECIASDPSSPEVRCVPKFLGGGFQPQLLLNGVNQVISGERNGTPINAWWVVFDRFAGMSPSALASFPPYGIYLEYDLAKVPRSFFFELALRGFSARIPASIGTLALVDLEHPNNSLLQPGLPHDSAFLTRLVRAEETRSGNIFSFGSWCGLAFSVEIEPTKRLFLLTDLVSAIQGERVFIIQVRVIFVVLASLGAAALLLLLRKGYWNDISLNGHILALLSLAMLIPMGGAYWAGTAVNRGMEKRERSEMLQTMRTVSENLPPRQKDFLEEYGVYLKDCIQRLAYRSTSEADFIAALASQCPRLGEATNLFTDVFVSDALGKAVFASLVEKRQEAKGYQLILGLMARRHFGANEQSEALLGKVMIEDADRFTGTEGDSFSRLPLGLISQIKVGRAQASVLPLVFRRWQRPLILLLQISNRRLMTAFLDREMKSGSLVSLRRSFHGRLEFAFTTKDSRYPIITFESSDSSPSFRKAVRALTQSGSFQGISDEISGATQNEGGSYAYFFSPRETFLQYRLLAVFDDREIDRNARLRERLLRAGFVSVLVLALFMGSLLSRRMLGPVAILDQGMDRIRSGDLQTTLPDLGTDEISVLGLNVNHLVKELRERERMQAYISETVLEAIRHPPSARELDARSREVTILISDIRGFTALSERHSPEEMFGMLNEYFESVEPILRSFGGQVQKFIGDAVYAVFPGEGRVGALGAVQAAREMKLFLEKFNHRRQA
jgi:HAMP domain-containing protein